MRARHAILAILVTTVSCFGGGSYHPQNGDIVFQTSRSAQSLAIQRATHSAFSHMGVVYVEHAKPYVYEAVGPVKLTPLSDWIQRGKGEHFVAKRLRGAQTTLTVENLAKLKREGEKLERRPYDPYFEWSDDRIYCSELVWKMYDRALGIQIGRTEHLGAFDLSDPVVEAKVQERWGRSFPRNEIVISPARMFGSDQLVTVYSQ